MENKTRLVCIPVLPQLGRWFQGGRELSGGQWQKIALSRAFAKQDADVLILDADPLQDISNLRRLNSVFKEGRLVDLDELPYERIFSMPDRT